MWRLALLMGLSLVVQAWVVMHAVVPAQDSVRYLATAQAIERDGWHSAVAGASDPPLFPTLVSAAHTILSPSRFANFVPDRLVWLRSLQLAATAALVASVIPLYAMLFRWSGARVALFGCVLFGVLGSTARLGADGLGDSLQLLIALVACCGLTYFLANESDASGRDQRETRRLSTFAILSVVGAALGLGLLGGSIAGALLPAVAIALLANRDGWNRARVTLRRRAIHVLGVFGGAAAVVVPYIGLTAEWNQDALLSRLRADHHPETASLLNFGAPASVGLAESHATKVHRQLSTWRLANGEPMSFGHKESSTSSRVRGVLPALGQFIRELAVLVGLPVGALAVFGLVRGQSSKPAIDRFFTRLALAYTLVVIVHAARAGYLSDRHLLPLVPVVLCWGARGAVALGPALEQSLPWLTEWADAWPRVPAAAWFARVVLTCVALLCAAQLIRPLHQSRWGHRQAAEWLAARGKISGSVLDTRGWTALYSGRPTYRHEAAQQALSNAHLEYVVVEQRELDFDSPRSQTLREVLSRSARQVMRFSVEGEAIGQGVCVYRWDPQRFAALNGGVSRE